MKSEVEIPEKVQAHLNASASIFFGGPVFALQKKKKIHILLVSAVGFTV
jgi:hypothetical protein